VKDADSERLVDLETRMAFQEQALQEFNDVAIEQRREIDALQKALRALHEKLEEIIEDLADSAEADRKPPHY